jgi:uncharacterized membrane protein YdjX (TVP38/TMEM64 family)
MLAFTSSVALVPSANLVWGKLVTFLLLWGGWVTGASISFGVGKLARPLLNRAGYKDTLKKYQQLLSKHMKFWLVLLFCFTLPSEIPRFLFGGMHYPFLKFLVAVAIVGVMIAIGAGTGSLLRVIKNRKTQEK